TVLDSPIRDTQWVGPSDEIVFTVTEAGHVWVSKDGGVSWNDHSAQGKLPGGTDIPSAKGAYEPPKGVQAFYFHPSTPEKMFFRGGGDTHWITTNAGESYDRVEGPAGHMGVATVRLHPMESDWVLAMVRRWACWSKDDTQRGACADDLFLTKDFGRTWQNLTERAQGRVLGFVDFDWGWSKTPGQMNHHTSYTRDTILATVFENRDEVREHLRANGVALATGWDAYVDFVHTSDYFGSKHTRTVPCGNQFEIMNDKLFLAVAEGCSEAGARMEGGRSGVRLKISADYGGSFRDACFPRPLVQRGYSVVHTTADTAFVNVDYAEGSRVSPYGDLLVADESLSLFGLALRRNARSISGAVDFAALQGLPGVYVANQLSEYVEPPAAKHGGAGTTEEDDMTFARSTTLITFNSGASWEPIKAPEYDTNRHPIHCDPRDGCSLHLHGTTSWIGGSGFAFVYSHASTPGLIISTGNVGTFLYQDSTINTYLSRDGGQTWEEVAKGSHIYEFGDSGGVIVMTKHGLHTASSTVMYSLDEGLTWEEETFAEAEQQVDIFNIRVEPDNQGKKFLIQGLTMDDGTGKARQGVLISLDFTALPEYKLCKSSDYEFWTPTASRCFLGQNISIQRQCWNAPLIQVLERNLGQGDYDMWDYGGEGGEAGAGEGAGAQAWAEPSPGKHVEGVLDLDDVTIAKVVGGRWRVLVEFYDPSEEASKSALPHVRQAATLLIDRSDCLLARVDASKYPHLAARHGATVLPHFVLFDLNDSLGTSYTGPVDAQPLANLLLHGHAHSGPLASLRKATRAFVDFRSDTTRRGQAHAEAQQLVEKLPEEAKESGEYYLKVMAAVIERGEEYIAKVRRTDGLSRALALQRH
ncbi:unnamed protein product, partial [Closterium sp. NIES-64]